MITTSQGDLFQAEAEAIVNTVNCVGVMGRGLALQFKKSYPKNFQDYAAACKAKRVQPGAMLVHETGNLTGPRLIVNFPTKRHWRAKSRMEDIESGLEALVQTIQAHGITSIAIPPLGCGLGGLDWRHVRPLIERALAPLPDVTVTLFEPQAPAAPADRPTIVLPDMTPGRAALVLLMHHHLTALRHPSTTLLALHKLLYFLQTAGEPLRLDFKKAHYGPYARNLRPVLNAIEGHFITGYADGGDPPRQELTPTAHAKTRAEQCLASRESTRRNIQRVMDLVAGHESPFGLELLATVHWVVTHQSPVDRRDVLAEVHHWNTHKRQFTQAHINTALDTMIGQGWLSPIA